MEFSGRTETDRFPVAMAAGTHPFPFRTRQLSPPAPMVLGGHSPGRVGRRRVHSMMMPAPRRGGHHRVLTRFGPDAQYPSPPNRLDPSVAERPRRRREDDNDDERRPSRRRPAAGKKPPARRGRDDRGRENRGRKPEERRRARDRRTGDAPAERRADGSDEPAAEGNGKASGQGDGQADRQAHGEAHGYEPRGRRGSALTSGATKTGARPAAGSSTRSRKTRRTRAEPEPESRSATRRPVLRTVKGTPAAAGEGRPVPGHRPRRGTTAVPRAGAGAPRPPTNWHASPAGTRAVPRTSSPRRQRRTPRARTRRGPHPAAAARRLPGRGRGARAARARPLPARQYPAARELTAFVDLTGSVEQHPVLMDCWRAQRRYDKVEELWEELAQSSPSGALVTEGRIVLAGAQADDGRLQEAIETLARRGRRREARPGVPPAPLVRARRPLRTGGRDPAGA